MMEKRSNWAGNYIYGAVGLHFPETVDEVRELVRRGGKVKALGSRHSFNGIADTPGELVSLDRLERRLEIDPERRTVTLDAGARYGQICEQLHRQGYAFPNLASLPHISVVGACATATHGSGDRNGNLATAVSAMEFITADGEVVRLSREENGEEFSGAVVGLGGLGVVTSLTLDVVPTFEVRQNVYENLPMAQLEEHFDEITSRAYSVSMLTDWQAERINQVWLKRPVVPGVPFEPESALFGATPAPANRHPIPGLSAENCTQQMGVPGPWYERLPHFRMGFTPSSGEELQSEYFVPRPHALEAFHAIYGLRDRIAPLLQISEIRTIAGDDLWMSPCFGHDCVSVHFTWVKDRQGVGEFLPLLEEALAPFEARPHWGKVFTMEPERVRSFYPRLADFQRLLGAYDPEGKFRNAFLEEYVFGE
ncbi:MAG: FAD-binding protein [Chloroflexia bacterium]